MNRKGYAVLYGLLIAAALTLAFCVICHAIHPDTKAAPTPAHMMTIGVVGLDMAGRYPIVIGTDGEKYVVQPDKNDQKSGYAIHEQMKPFGTQYHVQVADYVRLIDGKYLPVLDGVDLKSEKMVP